MKTRSCKALPVEGNLDTYGSARAARAALQRVKTRDRSRWQRLGMAASDVVHPYWCSSCCGYHSLVARDNHTSVVHLLKAKVINDLDAVKTTQRFIDTRCRHLGFGLKF